MLSLTYPTSHTANEIGKLEGYEASGWKKKSTKVIRAQGEKRWGVGMKGAVRLSQDIVCLREGLRLLMLALSF